MNICAMGGRSVLSVAGTALLASAAASSVAFGQVIEAGSPTSLLTSTNVNNGSQLWSLGSFNYGAGTDAHGGSGRVTHTYDQSNNLESIRIQPRELRNSAGPLVFINNPQQQLYGQVVFTPQVNLPYEITGAVTLMMTGLAPSWTSASGSVALEVLNGPSLATFGTSVNRFGAVSMISDLFNSNSPLTGSATGMLTAGVTYKWSYAYDVSSQINFDETMQANISELTISYMQLAFVPAPGVGMVFGLAGVVATRRRRD